MYGSTASQFQSVFTIGAKRCTGNTASKRGRFHQFHPKVWIIKETNPDTGAQQIKLIVLSRNLTGSNDLDVVCELVGKIGTKPATRKAQVKHAPLVDFLTWLIAKADNRTIRKNMRSLCKDIDYIERFDLTDSPLRITSFSYGDTWI